MQLAALEQGRGNLEAAIAALRSALAAQPRLTAAHKGLASLLAQSGRLAEARAVLEAALVLLPADPGLLVRLARLQALEGDTASALATADAAERVGPADARDWREIGQLRAESWRWEDAARALDEASRRDPGDPATEALRSIALQEMGDTPGALGALALATQREPGNLQATLSERLMLPQVYEDTADLARWRSRYAAGLAATLEESARWLEHPDEVFRLNRQNFLLAYQGEDDRELQRGYSSLIAKLAGAAHPEWREPRRGRFDGGRRLRVGFVSSIFRECTAGRYFERWVTGLDARRFERFVFHTAPLDDDFTRRIAAAAEHFETSREGGEALAARVAAAELDVVVYPEVGMTPASYLLAALRLAPVQLAGWGHPVTTGSDAIDGYLTCAMMEPADAAQHYVEPLVGLPGLGVDYAMPAQPEPAPWAALRPAAGGRLYICAQSLFKIHPEMDAIFAALLEADPQAVLAFYQAQTAGVTRRFVERLQRTLAARGLKARGQVKFLPRLATAQFRQALAAADMVLDTARWSGGNTSLDAIASGVPIVALPGRFMRGRQTAAMLEVMGLTELVAGDADEYVRIAVDVATDRDRNRALRERIVKARPALFEQHSAIDALEERLLDLAARAS